MEYERPQATLREGGKTTRSRFLPGYYARCDREAFRIGDASPYVTEVVRNSANALSASRVTFSIASTQ
jgi:hypothetical protein